MKEGKECDGWREMRWSWNEWGDGKSERFLRLRIAYLQIERIVVAEWSGGMVARRVRVRLGRRVPSSRFESGFVIRASPKEQSAVPPICLYEIAFAALFRPSQCPVIPVIRVSRKSPLVAHNLLLAPS